MLKGISKIDKCLDAECQKGATFLFREPEKAK